MRILFKDVHALGDACEDLIAIRDFHDSNPQHSICFRGFGEELFHNIPWIDWSIEEQNADKVVDISMDLIHRCNQNGLHVVRAIEYDMEKNTGMHIHPGDLVLPIQFTAEELQDLRIFRENGIPGKFWIINAGGKDDFTTKHYPRDYFQRIVDITRPYIRWVQVGSQEHDHKPLNGVVNLIGKTPLLRDLFKVFYRSAGVLTTISAPLHLSAMPMAHSEFPRPCVVIGGGREPQSFTLYPNHHWFSTVGCLPCSRRGCWKAKVKDENDDNQCARPMCVGGQWVGKCMEMISPDLVAAKVLQLDAMGRFY